MVPPTAFSCWLCANNGERFNEPNDLGWTAGRSTVAASAPALSAQPYNDTGSFYISPLGQYSIMDPRRESKDAFGYQVGLGANIAPNVALELDYGSISSKLKGYSSNFGPSEKLRALSLDALFIGASSAMRRIRPYDPRLHRWTRYDIGDQPQLGRRKRSDCSTAAYNGEYIPRNPGDVLIGVGFQ